MVRWPTDGRVLRARVELRRESIPENVRLSYRRAYVVGNGFLLEGGCPRESLPLSYVLPGTEGIGRSRDWIRRPSRPCPAEAIRRPRSHGANRTPSRRTMSPPAWQPTLRTTSRNQCTS